MRRYETIFILRPSLNEDEITAIIDRSTTILTEVNGQIIELDKWGMKKLAYPIKKDLQGYYVFCDYCSTPDAVSEMERKFRLDDAVLRYMTLKTKDDITDEEIVAATAQVAEKKAAAVEEADGNEEDDENDEPDSSEDDDDLIESSDEDLDS
jgi:small subunit ribosomal protein S6